MNLLRMYSEWASNERLTPTELERVLAKALEKDDQILLTAVLRQEACTPEIAQQIAAAGRPQAISAWINSRFATEEMVLGLVSTADVGVLSSVARNDRNGLSDRAVRLMWKRNDQSLRLALLRSSRSYRKVPDSWIKWLLSKRPFPGYAPRESLVFESITENNPELAWRIAQASPDLEVLCWVYGALPHNTRYEYHDSCFQDRVCEYLASGGSDPLVLSLVAETMLALLQHLDRSRNRVVAGSRELETALLILQALPQDQPYWEELNERVSASVTGGDPPTRERLLQSLNAGTLLPSAVDAVMSVASPLADELWCLVAPHPELTPHLARELLLNLDPRHDVEAFDLVISARSAEWLLELSSLLWESMNTLDIQVRAVVNRLPLEQQREFVSQQAERGEKHVARLVSLRLLPGVAVGHLPVTGIVQVDREIRRELFLLTRSELGDSSASWEIFEALSAEFTGTYGELLNSARLLAEQQS